MATHTPGDMSEAHFLTIAEVAARIRVSKMTVYRLVHSGELPAVQVGRSLRVLESAVHDYLKSSLVDTPDTGVWGGASGSGTLAQNVRRGAEFVPATVATTQHCPLIQA